MVCCSFAVMVAYTNPAFHPFFTHADESRRSKAFIRVCVCLFVCMIEPKRLKLQSPNLPQR